jgi:diamine N-acetyltransferase
MDVTIRKATPKDLQTLLDINYSSFEANATYDPYINMNWIHTQDAKDYFMRAITKKGYYASIAEVDGKAVGMLFMCPKELTYRTAIMIELDILAVLPDYRCQKIGKQLIEDAKIWAKKNGYHTIYGLSYSKNERAIAFYKREGFSIIDVGLEISL